MFDSRDGDPPVIAKITFSDSLPKLSLYRFEELASTNDQAWNLYETGALAPLAVLSRQQHSGRGQWGRPWRSEPGGLYLSVLVLVDMASPEASHLTLWSVWGIAHGLNQAQIPVRIKWPNDLVLERHKLGGIKCETKIYQGRITEAVIGIGINWSNPVPETGIQLQAYLQREMMLEPSSLEDLLHLVFSGLALGYERYYHQGIDAILAGFDDYFANGGQVVTLDSGQGTVTGINAQGELCLELRSAGAVSRICLPPGAISLGYDC